jgi:hypothetical protein
LGGDIIFSALSEINFWKYNNARYAIESMIGRIKSRFQHARPYFGLLILDSSPADSGISVVNDFLAENPDIYSVEMAIWQAKGHKGDYFREGEFFVFIGDASNDPFILKDGQTIENLPAEFDKDKVIRVPEELRMEFTLNLERALRDQAGITATGFAGTFFKDKKRLSDAFNLPSHNNDVISVDFYDHSDRLMDYLSMSIRNIPKEKIIYLGVDIGLTNDLTGLTIGYFDEHVVPFPDKPSFTEPSFVINTVCGISRKQGQETSISKIKDFILELSESFEIGGVVADQFQSKNLLQDLSIAGIPTKKVSVDRTNVPYNYLKNAIYSNRVSLPQSNRLKEEMSNLQYINNKIDHLSPQSNTESGGGKWSKDLADAVCSCIFQIYSDIGYSDQLSSKYSVHHAKNIISKMAEAHMTNFNLKNKIKTDISKNIF